MNEVEIQKSPVSTTHQPKIEDFALIKVFLKKGKYKHFIVKIYDGRGEDGDYEVNFLRQSQKSDTVFSFPKRWMQQLLD